MFSPYNDTMIKFLIELINTKFQPITQNVAMYINKCITVNTVSVIIIFTVNN